VKFVGPVNSAHVHCSREKSQQSRLEKKMKNAKHGRGKRKTCFPNAHLWFVWI